ncbi:hypothetical protein [Treponema zioleckii]|uniref:hypothetical protein n=1 Tax=Treponema zioleckii TaxID=331680 RepID=UPI00168ABD86|nr:hypothetical protein [Treponema zioleckii]
MDDLDISATGKFSFTVEPIPPFEMTKDAKTETTDFFDASYLRKKQTISFVWQKVNRARSYIFEIRDSAGKIVLRKILDGNENTNFVLDDLTILSKGEFNWSVKAVRFSDDKKTILVDGAGAQKSFTVDFAINSNGGKRKKKGEFYAE